jgi:serpin B
MAAHDPYTFARRDALRLAAALPLAGMVGPMPAWAGQATPVPVPAAEITELVAGNTAFAFDLYAALRDAFGGNLLISPYSISQALAMMYLGAGGKTETQMADVLSFTLDQPTLHETFGAINVDLIMRSNSEPGEDSGQPRRLGIANALWVEQTYPVIPAYSENLERDYGATLHPADFLHYPEETREEINIWVEDRTKDRIEDIIPPGLITAGTIFVLATAIYFYGSWRTAFDPADTQDGPFSRLDGSEVTIPLMYQFAELPYASGDGYQVVEFPYAESGLALTVILPDEGRFADVEAHLDGDMLRTAINGLVERNVHVFLPKFELGFGTIDLKDTLKSMGMTDAFSPMADFYGISDWSLMIEYVLHKTFIGVDEKGTEAAAATVVIATPTSTPPLMIDRPFLFAIRDTVTRTILFLGRVMEPTA